MQELQAQQGSSVELVQITALNADLEQVKEVISENLGAGGMSEFDLTRIKIPSGGSTAFEVQDLNGDSVVQKIRGIILFPRDVRGYWPNSMEESGGKERPVCHSNDAIIGVGDPGGECKHCAMAQYGSGRDQKGNPTRGQACKQMRQLFILREGAGIIPEIFVAPPTSLDPLRKYGNFLAGRGAKFSHVMTEIGLVKDKNSSGIVYSKATFKSLRPLTAEESEKVKQIAAMFRPLVMQTIEGQAEPGEQAFQ